MTSSILIKTTGIGLLLVAFTFAGTACSADDPSIKGSLRENVPQSMASFIEEQTIDEHPLCL